MITILLPCPFCGFIPDREDPDCIYPAAKGQYNTKTDTIEFTVWNINCYESGGGCGASILGDNPEDCITRWNKRV